jgi:hypothetical protein
MPLIASNGAVTGSAAGDYAAFVEQMRGGLGGSTGLVTRAQAARLLQQATFGPTLRELDRVQQLGIAAWIDDQITNAPATLHRPYIEKIYADFNGPRTDLTYLYSEMDNFIFGNNCTTPFARGGVERAGSITAARGVRVESDLRHVAPRSESGEQAARRGGLLRHLRAERVWQLF